MKVAIALLFASVVLALAEPPVEIDLQPGKEDDRDYGAQLIKKFNGLLEYDETLKAKFDAFEKIPKERAGGRYLGSSATPLILHNSEDVDFRDDGGRRDFTQTLVLYYSFAEGFHKGMEANSGVFAVFSIAGHQSFSYEGDEKFKLLKHTVTAKFEGFRTTLNAEQGDAVQPASNVNSKAEESEKPEPESEERAQ